MGRFCPHPDCDFLACGGKGTRPAQYERPTPPPTPPEDPPEDPPKGLH